jgi:Spy/CpxP family protein refolding chaperone
MLKGILAALATVAVLGSTAVVVQEGPSRQQVPGMMGPSMGMAQGMMMGGMMGQGMMGSGLTQMMGQGMGMMATGGPGAAAMLDMRDALDLTDEQVSRLETIRDELAGTVQPLMTAMMASHTAAAEAIQGDTPDFDAYQQGLQAAANIMVSAHVAMARSQVEAREVLTPKQLELLRDRGPSTIRGFMQMHVWPGMMGR